MEIEKEIIVKKQDEKVNIKEDEGEEEEEETVSKTDQDFLKEFLESKPKEFIEFLKNNNIPLDSYNIESIPRFIRVKPTHSNKPMVISKIECELKTELIPLNWLPNFYKLKDSSVKISSSNSYKSGIIYGMDASSGAAILALNPQPGDNVLDICCAPGTKLSMISDMLQGSGTITGVDISRNRLGTCKTILKKYKIPNARLFCVDGTTFNSLAPSSSDPIPIENSNNNNNNNNSNNKRIKTEEKEEEEEEDKKKEEELENNNKESTIEIKETSDCNNKRKLTKKKKGKKKPFDLPNLYFCNTFYMRYSIGYGLYDKVIVDAECSLDGSITHLLKYSKTSRNLNLENSIKLTNLQKQLIENGFNLLKPGGHLVYSTCSFSIEQNEKVVQYLLDKYSTTSKLIPAFSNINNSDTIPYSIGYIENTYRFYPKNGVSGMFISKIEKLIN